MSQESSVLLWDVSLVTTRTRFWSISIDQGGQGSWSHVTVSVSVKLRNDNTMSPGYGPLEPHSQGDGLDRELTNLPTLSSEWPVLTGGISLSVFKRLMMS